MMFLTGRYGLLACLVTCIPPLSATHAHHVRQRDRGGRHAFKLTAMCLACGSQCVAAKTLDSQLLHSHVRSWCRVRTFGRQWCGVSRS